jgi:hypothetical protein
MAHPSNAPDVRAAWRALQAEAGQSRPGWRTISLVTADLWRMMGGVRFPGGEEAILVGFRTASAVRNEDLPRGAGFLVERAPALEQTGAHAWFALTRASQASFDLFTAMVEDVSRLLLRNASQSEARLFSLFLGRIRAWQSFMSKPPRGVLGPEAELGLVGELVVLESLLDAGLSADAAVEAWQGPLDGLQDFAFDAGAIEVKASLAATGFPARISSLEQLDDHLVRPIFLAAVRAVLQNAGETLPGRIARIRERLGPARARFDMRLLHAGYDDAFEDGYTRRFSVPDLRLLRVGDDVPRLTRTETPAAVRSAEYELDLDLIATGRVSLAEALGMLGQLTYDA